MKFLLIISIVGNIYFGYLQYFQKELSWKLYKNSALSSSDLYLVLGMKHFGRSVQEEECKRLRNFYNKVNSSRKFYCSQNIYRKNPIKSWEK